MTKLVSEKDFDLNSKLFDKEVERLNDEYLNMIADKVNDVITNGKEISITEISEVAYEDDLKFKQSVTKSVGVIGVGVEKVLKVTAETEWKDASNKLDVDNLGITFKESGITAEIDKIIKSKLTNIKNINNSSMVGTFYQPNANANKIFLKSRDTYIKVVDLAIKSIANGLDPYSQIRQALKSIGAGGLYQVYYDNNGNKQYRINLESAIRRNIIDGMRDIAQATQDKAGQIFGSNGVEISAHMMPAPDHAPFQGHQYTQREFDEIQNNLTRRFTMWNCKHYIYRIVIGKSVQTYSNEELQDILENNKKGVTDNDGLFGKKGKQYTLYDATQQLRKQETKVRSLNRIYKLLKRAGDKKGAKDVYSQYKKTKNNYKQSIILMESYGIQEDAGRLYIKGV